MTKNALVDEGFDLGRGGEEGADGRDGAAGGGAEADIQGKGEGKWGVFGHVRGQRQIKSHTNGGPSKHREEIYRDAQECQDPDRSSHHLRHLL